MVSISQMRSADVQRSPTHIRLLLFVFSRLCRQGNSDATAVYYKIRGGDCISANRFPIHLYLFFRLSIYVLGERDCCVKTDDRSAGIPSKSTICYSTTFYIPQIKLRLKFKKIIIKIKPTNSREKVSR